MEKEIKITQGIKKIYILVMILPVNKRDLFFDITERFAVNYHLSFMASGIASDEIVNLLGLGDLTKSLSLSFIREDNAKDCLDAIEDKINQIGIQAVAFTIPLDSLMGMSDYLFLADLGGQK